MVTIQVLNLARRPDRREQFVRLCPQEGIQVEFVEAVDGEQLRFGDLVRAEVLVERYSHFTAGDVGCACSHKLMWERCRDGAEPMVIVEDDAILRGDFAFAYERLLSLLPSNWDIILLGYNFDVPVDVAVSPMQDMHCHFPNYQLNLAKVEAFRNDRQVVSPFPLNNAFGTCAYAITPNGADRMLKHCFPLAGVSTAIPAAKRIIQPANTIDAIMNVHYRKLRAFCSLPPLAITPNDPADSDARKPRALG